MRGYGGSLEPSWAPVAPNKSQGGPQGTRGTPGDLSLWGLGPFLTRPAGLRTEAQGLSKGRGGTPLRGAEARRRLL
eukprot:6626480-Pyramimonas_sp.AAC.1